MRRLGDIFLALAIIGLLIIMVARIPALDFGGPLEGSARVVDGDSLILNGVRVRLRGIDAPELAQNCLYAGEDYPCGREAQAALVKLVAGRTVTCENHGNDRYGRLLARCMAGTTELNQGMVEAGWAVAYGDYEIQERMARQAEQGLWRGEFMLPQDWRRHHDGEAKPSYNWHSGFWDWLSSVFGF